MSVFDERVNVEDTAEYDVEEADTYSPEDFGVGISRMPPFAGAVFTGGDPAES